MSSPSTSPSAVASRASAAPPKRPGIAPNAHRLPRTRIANNPDVAAHNAQPLDKISNSLRYKAAYLADRLADDILREFRYVGKKDKEYLKGLVWSFGVLFDKVVGGVSADAVVVRIPAKLLENVKAVLAIQAGRKTKPVDVTPRALDAESSAVSVGSRGCAADVALQAAPAGTPPTA